MEKKMYRRSADAKNRILLNVELSVVAFARTDLDCFISYFVNESMFIVDSSLRKDLISM